MREPLPTKPESEDRNRRGSRVFYPYRLLRMVEMKLCRSALLLVASLLLPLSCAHDEPRLPEGKPNVLFLFTDDQRADGVHALGNEILQTPNLDRLVESGFSFRDAYCMGGNVGAVCLPSRTMLLSGRSLFHLPAANADIPTFPRTMKAAGYETYHHGKKGNSPQWIHKQFDHSYYTQDEKERLSGVPGKEVADKAVAFLRDRSKDKPFFMYLAFGNPHDPRVVNPEYRSKYEDAKIPLPRNYLPVHPFDNGEMVIRDEKLAPWPRTPEAVRKHLGDYYGVISYLDLQIGRVLQALRDSGEESKTIIIFSSDHGLAVGSHGLMGKQNLYEDGMKAPLVFAGPGIPKGSSQAPVYLHDIYPSVCDLAGIGVPPGLDAVSFAPVLQGRADHVRDAVLLAYRSVQRAARRGDWKLIRYPQINRSQLFNLKDDPDEIRDLAGDPKHAETLREMTALLVDLQARNGDTLPLSSERPGSGVFHPPPPSQK
jgi:arylsulfatase A-like enzyme